jgi:putative peptidoglycan lipid II flippase
VGNIASRFLGLGRESTIAFFFGRGPAVEAFAAAWTIPVTVYDLLVNGAISAALIPVFSEHAEGDQREFWRIVSSVANITLLLLAAVIALFVWQAPLLVNVLIQDSRPDLIPMTTTLVQLLLPAVLLMGLSGLMTAVLYARRDFLLPAFAPVVFNLGIILGVVFFHQQFAINSLAAGVFFGALGQVALQAPGLRGLRYRLKLDMRHPAVQRILWLYAPVALGLSFSIIGMLIDRWLASGFQSALDTMRYATTLIQFPLGVVAAAISLAVLPTLSRQDASADVEAFRRTLGMGLKVVLLLVLPATAGLAALSTPITALIFERGAFSAQDTAITATALLFYLPSLPAAAIDQILIFAFYARKNTLTPNLVQGAAILIYLLAALPLIFFSQLGFLSLVIGNSAQWIGHALIMLWLLRRGVSLHGLRLGEAAAKALLASTIMALVVYGIAHFWLPALVEPGSLLSSPLLTILIAGIPGGLLYIGLSIVLRVEALDFFVAALRRRLGRGKG